MIGILVSWNFPPACLKIIHILINVYYHLALFPNPIAWRRFFNCMLGTIVGLTDEPALPGKPESYCGVSR